MYDIPDSTDWLGTPLSKLARVESALRCQVCKDFFRSPVITSCSHTFCSICIRRCLSSDGKCPACRTADQELKLRKDMAMQEMVDSFMSARPSVLEFARTATVRTDEPEGDLELPASKKRKIDTFVSLAEKGKAVSGAERRTRLQSRRSEDQDLQTQAEVIDDTEDEDFDPDDGLVACPMCQRRMKNEAVFPHLDNCPGPSELPNPSTSYGPLRNHARPSEQSQQYPHTNAPKRLPTLNYSLLKETVLRRKLKELGIPDWGSKPLLQKRHTEWMNIWNANCDSRVPKSKRELLQELDIWERTQGGHAPAASGISTSSPVTRKDFDASVWTTMYGDDFKVLIANARRNKEQALRAGNSGTILAADQCVGKEDGEHEHTITQPDLPDTRHQTRRVESEPENNTTIGGAVNEMNGEGSSAGMET
ncbi:postreplication repair E3 ubiquitin-protein ligase rad18 [Histoplasma capsulatum var. duboisii H88]|uniref:Postreplication repair E3 ubiquitin-protein ligase RAD18 n=1 Tax=Ajellomyces capsulatus (strain H88) TaxID=544711 RepID=F0UB69_AJEC8|nr:postreplication repair E3 ubiquitin-protein ligase rad18 [Histoplasma capsulatum var. duboisii H88]QSS49980.1 postreplication repair E3 ubiquitin-protein ligase rad18 [Histoplasma capsulatum var. duboisii H88]